MPITPAKRAKNKATRKRKRQEARPQGFEKDERKKRLKKERARLEHVERERMNAANQQQLVINKFNATLRGQILRRSGYIASQADDEVKKMQAEMQAVGNKPTWAEAFQLCIEKRRSLRL
jgi:hypothetical protein